MGLMDGELTPDEASQVHEHLIRCHACRDEYDALCESCAALNAVSFAEPDDAVLNRLWRRPFSRFSWFAGLWLVGLGWLLLAGYGLFALFRSGSEGLVPKLGIAGMLIGFVLLFGLALRDRLATWKRDPYKEVER
jgi:anti-sigma factor RsiW